jgi:hypothetical protein
MCNEIEKSDHAEQWGSAEKMNIILRQAVPSTDFTNDLVLSQYIVPEPLQTSKGKSQTGFESDVIAVLLETKWGYPSSICQLFFLSLS